MAESTNHKDGGMIHPSDPAKLIDLLIQTAAAFRSQSVFGEDQVIAILRHHMAIPFPSETLQPASHAEPAAQSLRMPAPSLLRPEQTIFSDGLICLECGQKFLTLKRHLRQKHKLSVLEYIDKHNLPPDYPVVAADYKEKRRELIKDQIEKYGPTRRTRQKAADAPPAPVVTASKARKPRKS